MGELLDALEAIRVDQASETGLVHVTVANGHDTFVEMQPRAKSSDVDALAEEIESTVKTAWERFRDEQDRVRSTFGIRNGSSREAGEGPAWVREVLEEVEHVECRATSSHGYVEAFLSGSGELLVSFLNNAVSRTDVPMVVLEQELNEALAAVRRRLAEETLRYCRNRAL